MGSVPLRNATDSRRPLPNDTCLRVSAYGFKLPVRHSRESGSPGFSRVRGRWIPAFAGMILWGTTLIFTDRYFHGDDPLGVLHESIFIE